jgi:hypothetical protein
MQINFGSVPDWIGGVGTTLAFAVALTVLFLDLSGRMRNQASQVSAWIARGPSGAEVYIANQSSVPVYDICATPRLFGTEYDVIRYPILQPGEKRSALTIDNVPRSRDISNELFGVEMLFADSAGRRWNRAINGELKRKWRRST